MDNATHLDFLNKSFPMRKTDKEKQDFRDYIVNTLNEKGIDTKVETTCDKKNNNIVIGDPTTAKAVFTAHYDTPARSLFPNIMFPKHRLLYYLYQFLPIILLLTVCLLVSYVVGIVILNDTTIYALLFMVLYYGLFFLMIRAFKNPNNYNDNTSGVATVLSIVDSLTKDELKNVAFILFDNEEKGKKGSAAYFKDHFEEMKERFLVNFDCVGNGDNIIFIAQKGSADSEKYEILKHSFEFTDKFSVDFCTHKEADSNSDHKNFPCGVACVACKKAKNGIIYTPYIHTPKDVISNNSNIDFIAKNTVAFVRKI